jgi:hypothetical protein
MRPYGDLFNHLIARTALRSPSSRLFVTDFARLINQENEIA